MSKSEAVLHTVFNHDEELPNPVCSDPGWGTQDQEFNPVNTRGLDRREALVVVQIHKCPVQME